MSLSAGVKEQKEKTRSLESDIRLNKERLHVAKKLGDQGLIAKYQLRGVTINDAMTQWVKKPPFLYRDKVREKYIENSERFDKQEKQIRKYIKS